jgi:type II secretory pathway component GspD/PulD (secretin)
MKCFVRIFVACTLALAFVAPAAYAQTEPEGPAKPCAAKTAAQPPAPEIVQTIFLANAAEQSDLNDTQTAIRNAFPRLKVYGDQQQNAIILKGTAEDVEAAQKIIAGLDLPRKLYRLTYTIAEVENGKRTSARHYVLLAVEGQKIDFKQGSRVPIVTGTSEADKSGPSTQMQYVDVGLNIEATVTGSPDNLMLRAKVEQSSLADEKPAVGEADPVVRQTVLTGTSIVQQGKPLVIGALDLPGTTKRQEIEVVAELVR